MNRRDTVVSVKSALCLPAALADLLEVEDEAARGDSGPLRLPRMEPDVNLKMATELYQS